MIDTDKYEGHLMDKAIEDDSQVWCWSKWLLKNAENIEQMNATAELLKDAPLLLSEVIRLQKEVDLLSIDVYESLELILDAYHPEVKNSVMSMFGDAIGDNWPYYGTPLPNKEMIE
jgi:hypothetical protein